MKAKEAAKVDPMAENREEYALVKEPRLLKVKAARYLTATGRGAPDGEEFSRAVGALYAAAYTLKMTSKAAGKDFKVMPLEGLWWGKRPNTDFTSEPRETWNWKVIIRMPDFVRVADLKAARAALAARGKAEGAERVKLERIAEGECVQALHVGPYSTERPTIDRMHALAVENGREFHGLHHEIYLSDPRRVPESKWKTLLRHPVKKRSAKRA